MAEDPTGNWSAKVTVGGSTFTKRIKIETVKPNRLKLALDFPSEILQFDRSQKTGLTVKWLHGAPGKGLKADVSMTLSSTQPKITGFEGYQFLDITQHFDGTEKQVFEGDLNENGHAEFNPEIITDRGAPGMLKAKFKCRAFEHGGDISTDQFSIMYSPYKSYVGFKIPKGKGWRGALNSLGEHRIPLAMVDAEGKKLSGNVSVEVYRIGWRWWWEGSENENLARYVRNGSSQRLLNSTTTVSNGKGYFDLKLKDRYWGRVLLVVKDLNSGHSSSNIVYMDYPGWRESMADNGSMGATMLSFETDKESYEVGETASLNIPSSTGGRLLVTIENGTRIIDQFWAKTTNGQTNVDIPLTAEMTPNAYAHVTLIQPHNQSVNDLPV
ncbi:MAG: hypothetical protein QF371_09620, partial [Flavobacteriales bacterium]|nr:hypothetical protein [Flavobacteriales bacterium]